MLFKKVTMKKERDFVVAVGTQDEFWIQAVNFLQAKFVDGLHVSFFKGLF